MYNFCEIINKFGENATAAERSGYRGSIICVYPPPRERIITSVYLLLESAIIQVHPRFGIAEVRAHCNSTRFFFRLFLHIESPVVLNLLL